MKVKCIKDTIGYKCGNIYETETEWISQYERGPSVEYEKYPEYFEEVKESDVPKWKVGDYVVQELKNMPPDYIKIYSVGMSTEGNWFYNDEKEETYRDPTPEELSTYFR